MGPGTHRPVRDRVCVVPGHSVGGHRPQWPQETHPGQGAPRALQASSGQGLGLDGPAAAWLAGRSRGEAMRGKKDILKPLIYPLTFHKHCMGGNSNNEGEAPLSACGKEIRLELPRPKPRASDGVDDASSAIFLGWRLRTPLGARGIAVGPSIYIFQTPCFVKTVLTSTAHYVL